MRLSLWMLGTEVFAISTDTPGEDNTARDLSGGTLTATGCETRTGDLFMGFTNGRDE